MLRDLPGAVSSYLAFATVVIAGVASVRRVTSPAGLLVLGCLLALLLALCVVGSKSEHDLGSSLAAMAVFASLGMIGGSLGAPNTVPILVATQAITALALGAGGVALFFSGDLPRLCGTFGHPTELAMASAFCFPLAVLRAILRPSPLSILGCATIAIALLCTWCRGPIVAGCIGGGVVIILQHRRVGRGICIATCIALSLLALSSFAVRSDGRLRSEAASRSATSRPHLWVAALSQLPERFWTLTPGEIVVPFERQSASRPPYSDVAVDPKNQLLAAGLSFGLLGLSAALLYCFGATSLALRSRRVTHGALGALLAVLIASAGDSPFFMRGHEITSGLLGLLTAVLLRASTAT
jgi:hypothetical protein